MGRLKHFSRGLLGGHFHPVSRIEGLINENLVQIDTTVEKLLGLLEISHPNDRIVKEFLKCFDIHRDGWEFFVLRTTANSYLSSLKHRGFVDFRVMDNLLMWYRTEKPGQ